jgi:hypothetical protein
MPSFMSAKRAKMIGVAAVGTLALAGAVSATALSSGTIAASSSASAANAYVTVAGSHQGVAAAPQADTMDAAQVVVQFDHVRFGLQHQIDLADAKAAAVKAADAKAADAKAADAKAADAKAAAAKAAAAKAAAQTETVAAQRASEPSGTPQQVAQQMLGQFSWSGSQFSCLEPLWERESGWSVTAENPSSGAYGIPQALSGSLMASAGPDWQTDAATQIRWGLTYIQGRYGSPCGAWAHEEADGWY